MAAHYDDPQYSYSQYWKGRDYEHLSEVIAINSLLVDKKFTSSVDIGGGFGRLTPFISKHSKKTVVVEPSNKLRFQASKNLHPLPNIRVLPGTAQATTLPNSSQDLAMFIRVIHHLPDPLPAFNEIHRILKPGGLLILEFANSHHFKARIQSWITGQPILLVPIEKRSQINIKRHTIPFVNHSPQTIIKLLNKTGFSVINQLSVSNFRSPLIKQVIPQPTLLGLEKSLQSLLGKIFFGPSIFLLAQKT